jgi:hypothetical protein
MALEHGIDWMLDTIKPRIRIDYGKGRIYYPDFIFGTDLYEVKSGWTYDRKGTDLEIKVILSS